MASRTLGVRGVDRPARLSAGVTATPLANVGAMFLSQRGVDEIVEITNATKWGDRFGDYISSFYGKYAVEGMFKNLKNTPAMLYARRFVAADAVAASKQVVNVNSASMFTIKAAQFGDEDKGTWGNRVGFEIEHSNRYSSTLTSGSVAQKVIPVNGAVAFEVGDIVSISGGVEYNKIASKDETEGTITMESAFTGTYASGIDIKTVNFDLLVYQKSDVGVESLKETFSNLSIGDSVSTYYADVLNGVIGPGSKNVMVALNSPAPTGAYNLLMPAETAAVTYLTNGADGTSPVTQDWIDLLQDFNNKPCRFIFCPESTAEALNKEGFTYGKTRGDRIYLANWPKDQTYEELVVLGGKYGQSSDVYGMINAQWIKVSDPIGLGVDPTKEIPNVGHAVGYIIYRLVKYGYQRVPAGIQEVIDGVLGIVGDQIDDDVERTVLADFGVNMIQYISGVGVVLRNARMPSTNRAYKWFNQIFMRMVYKKSFEESFKVLENDESGEELLRRITEGIRSFMYSDYLGNSRTGGKCAFLKYGDLKFEDVVRIECDASNNDLDAVLNGEVTGSVYFTPPPPAESIEIGVGINLELSLGKTI